MIRRLIGVEYFDDYMTASGYVPGPFGFLYDGISNVNVGDIIQADWDGNGVQYDHTMVVTEVTGESGSRTISDIKISGHTADKGNVPLIEAIGTNTKLRSIVIVGFINP